MRIQRRALFFAVWLVAAVPVVLGQGEAAASSQDAKAAYVPTLTFDVASVRQSPEANSYSVGGGFTPHTSVFRATNWAYYNLVSAAYGYLQFYQIVGLPRSWAMFNVEARSDSDADEKMAKLSKEQESLEQQHMWQALLADRFKLKAHWETRESEVLNLVVAKKGLKMQPASGAPPSAEDKKFLGDRPVPDIYQKGSSRTGFDLVGHGCSMDSLTETLAGQFGRPVLDKTGLTGKYDFKLSYLDRWPRDRADDDTNPVPTLDVAIQDQLGLKVESGKGPIRVLVVDHIEMPSAN